MEVAKVAECGIELCMRHVPGAFFGVLPFSTCLRMGLSSDAKTE